MSFNEFIKQLAGTVGQVKDYYAALEDQMVSILNTLGESAYNRAKLKLEGLKNAPDKEAELHGVIQHLERAYDHFHDAATRESFLHSIWDDFQSFFTLSPQYNSYEKAAKAALLICRCYCALGGPDKIEEWGAIAMEDYDQFAYRHTRDMIHFPGPPKTSYEESKRRVRLEELHECARTEMQNVLQQLFDASHDRALKNERA